MLRSLDAEQSAVTLEADVIIVGAGLAGLFLADRLVEDGKRVIVLESGGDSQAGDTHTLNAVEMAADCYRGADHGRFRCLGGTSSRWGGALLPYLEADLEPHPCGWHPGWGLTAADLAAFLPAAEAAFGVDSGSYEEDTGQESLLPGFLPRNPKWPSFGKRNSASIFGKRIRSHPSLEVWTDATVTAISLGVDGVEGVVARNCAGGQLTARAPCTTIAAGAIESTRLLLLLNQAQGGHVFSENSPLGLGFHDHLSSPIANIDRCDLHKIAQLFGFRFVPGGMRNLRFELSPEVRLAEELPAAFVHVGFSRDETSGFEGLRGLLQSVQKRQLPSLRDLIRIAADAPWFAQAVWWRLIKKRVLPPRNSSFELHLVTEQAPEESQRITLSDSEKDRFGLPLAKLEWQITDRDIARFHRIADLAIERWRNGALARDAGLVPRPPEEITRALQSGGGIYHPAGTTRIGASPDSGVVDKNLNVHGVPGLRVLSTSVFPTVGGSSPSLSLVLLALRLADDIAQSLDMK